MIINLYAIYDSKAEAYLMPFFMQNDGILHRTALDTLQDPSSLFAKHPEDYIMYHLGTYDDQSGLVLPFDVPKVLWKFIDLKPPQEET